MHISSVIKISFCRISFSGHQNKFCACLDSLYGSRVIVLVMCKNCSDISWHRLNLNQSKTNCPNNLNSDGFIVRELGPWLECIFRSLLQFLVSRSSVKFQGHTVILVIYKRYMPYFTSETIVTAFGSSQSSNEAFFGQNWHCLHLLSSKVGNVSVNHNTKFRIQWNLSVTTTSKIKFITCDLFSNVF